MASDKLVLLFALFMASCTQQNTQLKNQAFGKARAGEPVELYTLSNSKGMQADIMTYGGVLVSLKVPDRSGKLADVVLGFDTLDGYQSIPPPPYFGALIGRYGNRIGGARFTLNGTEYKLAQNNGTNHLHGGLRGFDKVVWKARRPDARSLE